MISHLLHKAKILKALCLWIGIPILIFMGINNNATMRRNINATTKILSKQAAQDKSRDTNFKKLISDNAQQTQILCTLIVRNSQNFTDSERINIQAICQRQINEASGVKSGTALKTGGNAPSTQATSNPSPQSKATSTQAQPDTSQPSTIQNIENTLTGVVDRLNPFNLGR